MLVLQDKHVLLVGLARSGIAAARLLNNAGAHVTISDMKTREQLSDALTELPEDDFRLRLGCPPDEYVPGSDLVVISPGVPIKSGFILRARQLGIPVIGELELAYRLSKGTVIAVTGTNGKTTTATLCGEVLKNAGYNTYVVGNIGTAFSSIANITQPEDMLVVEVSSFQLESIDKFRPRVSAILNITEDHLNRHGTIGEYTFLKERIFENQRKNDFTILNYDDDAVRTMADNGDLISKPVFFSRHVRPPFGAWVENGEILYGGSAPVRVCAVEDVLLPGAHNLENALAVVAMTAALNIPRGIIAQTLKTFAGVEHRIETVRQLRGVTYINDSKGTNVDASIKAVECMNRPTVLIAGGYDKNTDFLPFAHAISGSAVRHVILIGQTARQIQQALQNQGIDSFSHSKTLEDAVSSAQAIAEPGENVLLSPACASFDMFEDYEQRGRIFKEIVYALE